MATTQSKSGLAVFSLSTSQVTTGDPETVVNDSAAQAPVGALIKFNGNIYRYVQYNSGTNTIAASTNGVTYWKTLTPNPAAGSAAAYVVTCDAASAVGGSASGTPSSMNQVAGIIKGVVTTLYYTWIQVGGICTCQTTASMAAGDLVLGQTTANYQFGRAPVGTSVFGGWQTYGIAQDARNGTTTSNTILLDGMLW